MWDNIKHTHSNNYASIEQILFVSIGGTYREFAGVCVQSWSIAGRWRFCGCSPGNGCFSIQWKGWHSVWRRWVASVGDTGWRGLRGWYRLVSPIPFRLSCNKRQGPLELCQSMDSFIPIYNICFIIIILVPACLTRQVAKRVQMNAMHLIQIWIYKVGIYTKKQNVDQPDKKKFF